jgi:hypothetical protein
MPDQPARETGAVSPLVGSIKTVSSDSATLSSLALSDAERPVHTDTVADRLALGEHEMRRELARGITRAFVVGNLAVWLLVAGLAAIDVYLLVHGMQKPDERIIDRSVIKTLVGATSVQVGLILVAIAANLFPKASGDAKPWWKFWG